MLHREVEEHDRERELDRAPHNEKTGSVTFSKVAGFQLATLLKVTLFHGCFLRFLNCASGTNRTTHYI